MIPKEKLKKNRDAKFKLEFMQYPLDPEIS